MKNKGLIATIVVMSAVIITLIVILVLTQMPSISPLIFNNKNSTTETIIEQSTIRETETKVIETTEQVVIKKVTSETKTYTSHNGRINIDYPVLSGMNDLELEKKINEKLYNNAISVVKLYPISTALQRLNISCDVKILNDDVVTVLYSGRVVGDEAKGNNVNRISPVQNTTNANVNIVQNDPYLDGFVDPLANGSYIAPSYEVEVIVEPSVSVTNNENPYNNSNVSGRGTSTSDTGPSVAQPISPTAPGSRRSSNNNSLENGTIVNSESSSDGVYGTPNLQGSSIPVSSYALTEIGDNSTPVYGYTNTNLSASTIDQRIFYINSIDLKTGKNLTLKDYVSDFEKLAKYARSSNVELTNIDDSDKAEVRTYIRRTVVSKLTEYLKNNSDFRDEGVTSWPRHFSYKDEDGNIYFTIKLSSKLGNYAIIKYNN